MRAPYESTDANETDHDMTIAIAPPPWLFGIWGTGFPMLLLSLGLWLLLDPVAVWRWRRSGARSHGLRTASKPSREALDMIRFQGALMACLALVVFVAARMLPF